MLNETLLTNNREGGESADNQFMQNGVCDFVSKYNYTQYNQALSTIPDDASNLDQILNDLKEAFKSGKTRDYQFKLQQLRSLSNGLEEMKEELCGAAELDLGRGKFLTYIAEVGSMRTEI